MMILILFSIEKIIPFILDSRLVSSPTASPKFDRCIVFGRSFIRFDDLLPPMLAPFPVPLRIEDDGNELC